MVGDVLSNDVPQLSLFLGVLGNKSSGVLLGDDEGEGQLSVELVGDTDNADLGNKRTLDQVSLHLGGGDLETADLQPLLETIDDENLHVLVNRRFVTGADLTVDDGFFRRLLVIAVARSHRAGLDDQFSGLVETSEGTIGPLDTSNKAGQQNASGDARFVALFTVGLHTDHTGLGKTVALEDSNLRKQSG